MLKGLHCTLDVINKFNLFLSVVSKAVTADFMRSGLAIHKFSMKNCPEGRAQSDWNNSENVKI